MAVSDDNPFEKYRVSVGNNARGGGGLGFSSRKGQRVVRYIVCFVVTVGVYIGWFRGGSNSEESTIAGLGGGRSEGESMGLGHQSREGKYPQIGKEKATFVMLVRNREVTDALITMKQIEDRFNKDYHYPWTFLNDEPFEEEFINHTSARASGRTEYGLISPKQWSMPGHIDEDKFQEAATQLRNEDVVYADSKAYRHMCRFNAGFFYDHDLMRKYDWYWRVEPGTGFYCDQTYDPFTFMRENKKRYSFVITMPEFPATIKTLWNVTQDFLRSNPQYLAKNNSLNFIVDDIDEGINAPFNLCHFWSNFEIADLNFWRSEAYQAYFQHLDKTTGFYYERWGDAPIHTLAAALFLSKDEIHFWDDVGYGHSPYGRCPQDDESQYFARCVCPYTKWKSFDFHYYSCLPKWYKMFGRDEKGEYIDPAQAKASKPTARFNLAGHGYSYQT